MIYTCTLNPAIDYKINVDLIHVGDLNRFSKGTFLSGGKGINVSIALKKIGIKSTCTGFIGGFTGAYIQSELENRHGLTQDFVPVKNDTRLNIKIMGQPTETELNHDGNIIFDSEKDALLEKIKQYKTGDILICGGSSAKGQPDLYQEIASICEKNHVRLVMDTPGIYMSQFLSHHPFLIKPNVHELSEYFNRKLTNLSEIILYGRKLLEVGAENVLISMGSEGSVLITQHHIYRASTLSNLVKNTVGAGDSMVAGFIAGYEQTRDLQEAYRSAVALASATTFGDELADPNLYHKLLKSIQIKEIHS